LNEWASTQLPITNWRWRSSIWSARLTAVDELSSEMPIIHLE
jgi:hypothetical protein